MIKLLITLLTILFFTIAKHPFGESEEWKAPQWADTLKNPLANNSAETIKGKIVYEKFCLMCHGIKGKGDGELSASIAPPPKDLTVPLVQQQTDGALYWKIMNGKSPMPSYEIAHKIDHNQCWQLINYIRELGKTNKK